MNSYQLRILWLAIGVATMALMFPPWTIGLRLSTRYQAFWVPPYGGRVNGDLLLIELGIVALLGAGAWVTAKDERFVQSLVLRFRGALPSRKEFFAFVGFASLLCAITGGGLLLMVVTSGKQGHTFPTKPVALTVLAALVLLGITWRDYRDSLTK